jgi:CubicO group peptidase (beta-lactamase class C family)
MPRPRRAVLAALALALPLAALPALAEDGPVVGTPPPGDAVEGWVENWMDPDFWSAYVRDAVLNGHINLPYPNDPVKPEAYLPNVPVPNGGYVSALPVAPVDLSGVTYEWQGETKTIEQFVRTTRTDQVVLVRDGHVIGELYAGGYSADVRHQAWSVTKTFVAAVVGIAHGEGRIASLQEPIDAYVPDLAGTEWEGVSIEDVLQMESGVHWDEDTPVLAVNTQVEQWRDLALDLYTDGAAGQTRNEFLATLPAAGYEPGTRFSYNSGNTQVLAWLTELLYGKTFNEILAEKLWQPMGAAGDAVMTSDRVGSVIASHGLFARPHDFARFGELLRNGGRTPEGRQVLPAEWVEAMTTMTDVSDGSYGYQTWAHPIAAPDAYSASGFQGQKITVLPSDCLTGVRTSHALGVRVRDGELTDPAAYGFGTEFYAAEWQTMLRAVADAVGGCGSGAGSEPATTASGAETDRAARSGDTGTDGAGTASASTARALPATGGADPALALGLLTAAALAARSPRATATATAVAAIPFVALKHSTRVRSSHARDRVASAGPPQR